MNSRDPVPTIGLCGPRWPALNLPEEPSCCSAASTAGAGWSVSRTSSDTTQFSPRQIRVSSRALGPRIYVHVYVYDTVAAMRTAGEAFNGNNQDGALGITQAWVDAGGRAGKVVVRLARGHLGTQIVAHEIHHAATALYGAQVSDRVSRVAHLNHYNEPFAHLYSDLLCRLVDRLYALGYYGDEG